MHPKPPLSILLCQIDHKLQRKEHGFLILYHPLQALEDTEWFHLSTHSAAFFSSRWSQKRISLKGKHQSPFFHHLEEQAEHWNKAVPLCQGTQFHILMTGWTTALGSVPPVNIQLNLNSRVL